MDSLGPDDILLFLDESSIKHFPTITRCWAIKGSQPQIPTLGGREKQNIIGVVNPIEGYAHIELVDALKTPQFQIFLESIINLFSNKGRIIIILDNAKIHHAKALQPFLDKIKGKLELIFLPPYSPELNPIERFWRYMRKQVTHNTFFITFEKLIEALRNFFQKFKLPSIALKSLCGTF